jgi:hypothetical protein
MNLDEVVSALTNNWGANTLQDLLKRAVDSDTELAFSAIGANGVRFVIALCTTNSDQIAAFGKRFDLETDTGSDDWRTLRLAGLARRALEERTILTFVRKRPDKTVSALALIAADPESIVTLTTLFVIP